MSECIRLTNIRTTYAGRTVLAIDRLTLHSGRIYTLTGANGAGKSTLLSHLALLTAPTSGEIAFGDRTVRWNNGSLQHLRRQVTLVHQSPYLFTGSVFTNVAYGLKLRGVHGEELKSRVESALTLVGLGGFGHRRSRELSGGEAQRVALARALALRTGILLLDEPLANVDRATSELLTSIIAALPADGTTVIITTHDPEHAERLGGDRIHLVAGELANPLTGVKLSSSEGDELCRLSPKPAALFSIA
ncbi:ABC transporter ATP-binding protein [Geobacter sulfurreducens]|uniref:energy-coupling factor ABC transporter ATP-binding protein n=1 Tax=Geobacter sulfurreducens TaxID=35554 RepID=UPI001BDCDF4C|nr:ABC transporter ATP-binding protein [Geobacter sulfurreducens]QVW34530.1 ABC transporter ATP-binding protein [Geobacter sulfurreducens]